MFKFDILNISSVTPSPILDCGKYNCPKAEMTIFGFGVIDDTSGGPKAN